MGVGSISDDPKFVLKPPAIVPCHYEFGVGGEGGGGALSGGKHCMLVK